MLPKPLAAKLSLLLGALGLTLSLLEGVSRAFDIRAHYPEPRVDTVIASPNRSVERDRFGFIPFATIRSRYASDPRNYFGPAAVVDHVHNSVGWRDQEHAIEKPRRTYRILGLGDSYLWGQGVRREDICLTRLGKLLADNPAGLLIETINTGQSGMNTANERDLLAQRGLAYDPDLVIVHFVPNDVGTDLGRGPKVEFFTEYTAIYQTPWRFSGYSHLFDWARQRYLRHVRGRAFIRRSLETFTEDGPGWSESRSALANIDRICRNRGIGLLVVLFPFFHELDGDYPFQPVHKVVREYCRSRKIPFLDLRERYRDYCGPELWVHPTDQHPNEIAHEIAARSTAGYLMAHPELFSPARGSGARHDE